jgi:hypothetical protein
VRQADQGSTTTRFASTPRALTGGLKQTLVK